MDIDLQACGRCSPNHCDRSCLYQSCQQNSKDCDFLVPIFKVPILKEYTCFGVVSLGVEILTSCDRQAQGGGHGCALAFFESNAVQVGVIHTNQVELGRRNAGIAMAVAAWTLTYSLCGMHCHKVHDFVNRL